MHSYMLVVMALILAVLGGCAYSQLEAAAFVAGAEMLAKSDTESFNYTSFAEKIARGPGNVPLSLLDLFVKKTELSIGSMERGKGFQALDVCALFQPACPPLLSVLFPGYLAPHAWIRCTPACETMYNKASRGKVEEFCALEVCARSLSRMVGHFGIPDI
jgi:hypothetical protein